MSDDQISKSVTLDELYHMVAHIYGDRNAERSATATFSHFVEVCGMLTPHARGKKRDVVSIEDALCKAMGWFFPLLAKFGVGSVEELIYRKYPYACPYCRLCPHVTAECKEVKGEHSTVDKDAIRRVYEQNRDRRPGTLDQWREMFSKIYPRQIKDDTRSVLGLMEELGELAEAIRVFDRYPKYFAGEAADVFSYLMGLANEHYLREAQEGRRFSFDEAIERRYPGLCVQCGYEVCVCPVIPDATVGRLAKELELAPVDTLFRRDAVAAATIARDASARVLQRLGGFTAVAKQFPFDRGEANRALVLLCLQLADASAARPEIAKQLREAAMRVANTATYAGSRERGAEVESVELIVREVWPLIGAAVDQEPSSLVTRLGQLIVRRVSRESCRFGVVTALPKEFAAMRAMMEHTFEMPVQDDPNDYIIGSITTADGTGAHGVVLTLLKEMGNNSASSAATNLLRSFGGVTDVFMTGIAGGAPHPGKPDKHVRLGDIVVVDSRGILQYDNVKVETGTATVRAAPKSPSADLLGRVRLLEAGRIAGQRPWEQYVRLGRALEASARPQPDSDKLFAGGKVIEHPPDAGRSPTQPRVHYGGIGSANTLLKDSAVRDLLRDQGDIRAYEMEGSGLADGAWSFNKGYIVVRGVCDYCDEHKNDAWQGYAAVVAAAYTRALIASIPVGAG